MSVTVPLLLSCFPSALSLLHLLLYQAGLDQGFFLLKGSVSWGGGGSGSGFLKEPRDSVD